MADPHSMTLQERMNTINNAEHGLTDGLHQYTFQEACNRWLKETGVVNGVDYTNIGINQYSPGEVFAIVRHKTDLRSETATELLHELGPYYPLYQYTAEEILNIRNRLLVPYSLLFDGVNDYVSIANDSSLILTDLSMSVWAKLDDLSNDTYATIVSKGGDYALEQNNADARLKFTIYKSATYYNCITDAASIAEGVWFHAVATYDGSNMKVYINGKLVKTLAHTVDPNPGTGDLLIGAATPSANFWEGKIDEVSLFNKALTQAEVNSLYAANPQNAGDAVGLTNLVGYWKFDEGTGEPQDSSGNGNHGTITGAAWTVH